VSTTRVAALQALDTIDAGLGPRGQWPSWVTPEPATGPGRRDISPPITAMGVLALQGLAEGAGIVRRSRTHLELTVLPDGMWRYYANIPADTDDSAMCALALGSDHPVVARTRATIASTLLPDGRFPTWFEPGWAPAVDAVPNANVIALLGEVPETPTAIAWLDEVVASGREVESSAYYVDPLDVHLAIRRGVDAGVTPLRPALASASGRAGERLAAGGLSPYRTAQALLVAGDEIDTVLRETARKSLLVARDASGAWPRETLFVAARTDAPGRWLYQSWSVVTALCVRALLS